MIKVPIPWQSVINLNTFCPCRGFGWSLKSPDFWVESHNHLVVRTGQFQRICFGSWYFLFSFPAKFWLIWDFFFSLFGEWKLICWRLGASNLLLWTVCWISGRTVSEQSRILKPKLAKDFELYFPECKTHIENQSVQHFLVQNQGRQPSHSFTVHDQWCWTVDSLFPHPYDLDFSLPFDP